ncbi:MAG TPA: hypothetical protein VKY26_09255 [Actinomycetota bacterium]|nr:hypothetical protein [Actinomycetota bacterium]
MSVFGWIDLILIAVVVITLTASLAKIISQLQHVTFTLGTIIAGVAAIANQTQTVPPTVGNVNTNLAPVRAKADALAGRAGGGGRHGRT